MERPPLRNRGAQQQRQQARGGQGRGASSSDLGAQRDGNSGAIGAPIGAGHSLPSSGGGGRPPARKAPPGLPGRGSVRGGRGARRRHAMESSVASLPDGPSLGAVGS